MKITAEAITVTIGAATLLEDVSLTAKPGELLGLVGPNGAGKSTLLKVLAGLRETRGSVRYNDRPQSEFTAHQRAQQIGYLAQRAPVAWPLSVERLVALGRLPHLQSFAGNDPTGATAITAALADTDTLHLRQRIVDTLSGGELARVLMARALAVGGKALLADEPVAALDPYHQLQVMEILRSRADQGTSVIVVLHEVTLAARFCDHLVLLDRGRIAASGPPSQVLSDENLRATYHVSVVRGERDGSTYLLPWQRTDHAVNADARGRHKSA